jgi:hypothetical protein
MTTARLLCFCLFSGPLLQAQNAAEKDIQNLSAVHIECVDTQGRRLHFAKARLRGAEHEQRPIEGDGNNDFRGIPYGDYIVEAAAPGFNLEKRRLSVSAQDTWLTVSLAPWAQEGDLPSPVLAGRILTHLEPGSIWAKLIGVYNGVTLESGVTGEGFFHFEPRVPGVYVLLLIRAGQLIEMRKIDLLGGYQRVEIRPQ